MTTGHSLIIQLVHRLRSCNVTFIFPQAMGDDWENAGARHAASISWNFYTHISGSLLAPYSLSFSGFREVDEYGDAVLWVELLRFVAKHCLKCNRIFLHEYTVCTALRNPPNKNFYW